MRLRPTQNIFFEIILKEDGFSTDSAKASGYHISDLIKKGYRYVPDGDRYVRNISEFKIKPAGIITLGLLTYAAIEGAKLLVK
ncbi:MAG: hypothetical protein AAB788_03050 [Patescibacteria group bacterium]